MENARYPVVLTCVAYILMCTAVLYYMEKYKPVRFAYDQSFPTGRHKTNYREASMRKVRAIVLSIREDWIMATFDRRKFALSRSEVRADAEVANILLVWRRSFSH